MRLHRVLAGALLLSTCIFGGASAQSPSEVTNGATCVPYPPPGEHPYDAIAYRHFLFGFRQSAFCHLPMTNNRRLSDLSYVLVTGSSSTTMRLRICVYTAGNLGQTCGWESTIGSGSAGIAVLYPPSLPDYAQGAYVSVGFSEGVSTVQTLIPVWNP